MIIDKENTKSALQKDHIMSNNEPLYILSISNRSESIYEMQNIVNKREQFYIIHGPDMNTIINNINERYQQKEDKVMVVKIINTNNHEQITLEFVFDGVNYGFYIKKSNPNKNITYNTDNNNYYSTKNTKNLFPFTEDKILNYDLIKSFFSLNE